VLDRDTGWGLVVAERDMFEAAEEYEESHPGVAEAMARYGASIERYEASLSALYMPVIVTSGSTEDPRANME
jgi:hypothetical protein